MILQLRSLLDGELIETADAQEYPVEQGKLSK